MKQPAKYCMNCGEPVSGLFCSNCGQETTTGPLTWRSITGSVVSNIIGSGAAGIKGHNARYGILYTLWQLVKCPGRLIGEYIDGHRLKYHDPVNLLLLFSTIYILLASLLKIDFFDIKVIEDDTDAIISTFFEFFSSHPWFKALLQVPFVALTMQWFFRKRSSFRYMDYVYVSIFFSTAFIIAAVLFLPFKGYAPDTLWPITKYITIIIMLVLFTQASCKLFHTGWIRALVYNICIQIISVAFIFLTVIIILFVIAILHDLVYSTSILLGDDVQDVLKTVDSLKS